MIRSTSNSASKSIVRTLLPIVFLLGSCTGSGDSSEANDPGGNVPPDLLDGEIPVTFSEIAADPNLGTTLTATRYVVIDGISYLLYAVPSSTLIGFDNETNISLAGRQIRIAGDVRGDTFHANYVELLPPSP